MRGGVFTDFSVADNFAFVRKFGRIAKDERLFEFQNTRRLRTAPSLKKREGASGWLTLFFKEGGAELNLFSFVTGVLSAFSIAGDFALVRKFGRIAKDERMFVFMLYRKIAKGRKHISLRPSD
ncbi:MAG: hypothetical protein FWH02_07915 [Oscillospiraceae bacterium]|nr:hypothetical protein [Oscillospiraceae bacterium]